MAWHRAKIMEYLVCKCVHKDYVTPVNDGIRQVHFVGNVKDSVIVEAEDINEAIKKANLGDDVIVHKWDGRHLVSSGIGTLIDEKK